LLSFEDIKNQRLPKDAPSEAPYFMNQTANDQRNIQGLNWRNGSGNTGTEPPGAGF
jgi:hypothetical protein